MTQKTPEKKNISIGLTNIVKNQDIQDVYWNAVERFTDQIRCFILYGMFTRTEQTQTEQLD